MTYMFTIIIYFSFVSSLSFLIFFFKMDKNITVKKVKLNKYGGLWRRQRLQHDLLLPHISSLPHPFTDVPCLGLTLSMCFIKTSRHLVTDLLFSEESSCWLGRDDFLPETVEDSAQST